MNVQGGDDGRGVGEGFSLSARSCAFFINSFCNSSVIFLVTALLMASDNEGDAVARASGVDSSLRLSSVLIIAGAKTTDTIPSTINNPARMNIARATGESPLRAAAPETGMLPRTLPPIRLGGAGLPIVSA